MNHFTMAKVFNGEPEGQSSPNLVTLVLDSFSKGNFISSFWCDTTYFSVKFDILLTNVSSI